MALIVGIDGTGPFFNSTYEKSFKNSFVRRICPDTAINKRYFRGPIGPGGGLPEAINGGYKFLVENYGRLDRNDNRVLLTGYSRGGLGVLVIAEKLKKRGIPVDAMLLFDAVDRHIAYDAPTVPDNVRHVLHLRRSPSSGSRKSFGNCGTAAANSAKTKYKEEHFFCTHGGVGGTPWETDGNSPNDFIDEGFPETEITKVSYAWDKLASDEVWKYAQSFILEHRFMAKM